MSKKIEWTAEMDALIGRMADRLVAERLGFSLQHVYWRRTLLGIPAYRKHGPAKEFWTPEVVAMLGTDTDKVIAEKLARPHQAVYLERRKRGIKAFGQAGLNRDRTEGAKVILAEKSDLEAAAILGVSKQRVNQMRQRHGIPQPVRPNKYLALIGETNPHGLPLLSVNEEEGTLEFLCPCWKKFFTDERNWYYRVTCGECTKYHREGYIGKHIEGSRLTIREIYIVAGRESRCKCDCSCGGKWEGNIGSLLQGFTKSCGCQLREYWESMKGRSIRNKEKATA